MDTIFYVSAFLAILSVGLALTSRHPIHALLFFLTSLLALALNIYVLGNEFLGALLVIVYAGAIMVLFVFVVMLLNIEPTPKRTHVVTSLFKEFFGPASLALIVFVLFIKLQLSQDSMSLEPNALSTQDLASALFNDGWFFIELLSLLLTAAFIGAFHVGRRRQS